MKKKRKKEPTPWGDGLEAEGMGEGKGEGSCFRVHMGLKSDLEEGSKTHKRLKERFFIRQNRTTSFNLLCVLNLFSERWQSTLFQIDLEEVQGDSD